MDNSNPFCSGDFWILHSDVVIDSYVRNGQLGYEYKFELENALNKERPIVFLKSEILPNYIDILSAISKPFILITASNSDLCPPYLCYPPIVLTPEDEIFKVKVDQFLNNSNLIAWYTKNPGILHPKLKPYPLGPKWQWKSIEFFGEDKKEHLRIFNIYGKQPNKKMLDKSLKKNLLYFNYSEQATDDPFYKNHKNIRNKIKSELIKRFPWNDDESFEEYIKTLSTYKFAISPPGKGIDTHRCWEALMVGTIPLVISSTLNELYKDLPVLVVNDWNQINEEYLNKKYNEIIKLKYNFEKIYCNYWLKKIKECR